MHQIVHQGVGHSALPSGFDGRAQSVAVTVYLSVPQVLALHALQVEHFGGARQVRNRLVQNHPFVDGNKRTGAMACELFLEINEHILLATDEELEALVMATARGNFGQEALAIWIRQRLRAA